MRASEWKTTVMAVTVVLAVGGAWADTWYVSTNSAADGPGTAWTNAFHTIRGAVDAASGGDTVLVTNGVYAEAAEIAVSNTIVIESVNGPEVTIVDGQSAHRCFNLGTNACTLGGFTLANGHVAGSENGGGVFAGSLAPQITNCVFIGNSAYSGGGSRGGSLYNCTFTTNASSNAGGGSYVGALYNCRFIGNSSHAGGGSAYGALHECTYTSNSATYNGGASAGSTLYNCLLTGNSAVIGGGNSAGILYNCTLAGNTASTSGGGCDGGTLFNCIVWNNTVGGTTDNWAGATFSYSCTAPLPAGDGNLETNPLFFAEGNGNYRLHGNSPCREAGTNQDWMTDGVDLDGVARIFNGRVDMGAYEWIPSVHYVAPGSGNVWPYTNWVMAATNIQDAVDAAVGGETVRVTNGIYTHASAITVSNAILIESVNGPEVTVVDGQSAHRCFNLGTNVHCVLSGFTITNGHSTSDGGGIRCDDAVPVITNCAFTGNSAANGGGIWYGTLYNCTFTGNSAVNGGGTEYGTLHDCTLTGNTASNAGGGSSGGTLYNCTLTGNSGGFGGGAQGSTLYNCTLTGNSVTTNSSPSSGLGGGSAGCTLYNCTLMGNSALKVGGGSYGGTLYNCTLTSNTSVNGGGSFYGTLYNCSLSGNSATTNGPPFNILAVLYSGNGGGCFDSTLINCTLTGNTATNGGGVFWGSLTNCIVWNNSADMNDNWCDLDRATYTCTTPLPSGTGNITNDTLFADAAAGDYRLQVGSPCVDTAIAASGITNDVNNVPRPLDGDNDGVALPDMGAYELANPASDTDGDSLDDWREVYSYGSDPVYNDSAALAVGRTQGEAQGEANVTSNPSAYGLYTSNSITDLNMGYMMLQTSNGWMHLGLQLQQCTNLAEGVWTNIGDVMPWEAPAGNGQDFYRVHGQE